MAQDDANKPRLHFAIEAGFTMAGFTSDVGQFDKNSAGYNDGSFYNAKKDLLYTLHIGTTFDYRIGQSLSLAVGAALNGKGVTYNMDNPNVTLTDTANNQKNATDTYTFDLLYLEVPVMIQYHLPIENAGFSMRIYGGLSPGFNISKHGIYDYYTLDNNNEPAHIVDDKRLTNVKSFMVSPVFGLWAYGKVEDLPFSFLGDLRFEQSLSNIFRPGYSNANWFTSAWNINLGFGVRF